MILFIQLQYLICYVFQIIKNCLKLAVVTPHREHYHRSVPSLPQGTENRHSRCQTKICCIGDGQF